MTDTQKQIIDTIESTVRKYFPNFSLGKQAYNPEDWEKRGEVYGTDSTLVIVHDGGNHAGFFNWDYCEYYLIDEMADALKAIGFFSEQCTGWYSAIYPL